MAQKLRDNRPLSIGEMALLIEGISIFYKRARADNTMSDESKIELYEHMLGLVCMAEKSPGEARERLRQYCKRELEEPGYPGWCLASRNKCR